jgi:hypothetical protein
VPCRTTLNDRSTNIFRLKCYLDFFHSYTPAFTKAADYIADFVVLHGRCALDTVPSIFGWLSRFKKVFFVSKDKELYGRVIVGKAHTQFSDILTVQVFKGVAGSP